MKSTEKTTAAKLRSITGEKDSVWADILGKSVHTIRHLEAGTLKLSPALAAKMNYETGISIKWLLDGKPKVPPVSADGRIYTKKIYENVRAGKKSFATVKDSDVKNTVADALVLICRVLVSANRQRNFHLAVYRIAKALAELRAEFGEAKDFSYEKVLNYVQQPYLPLPADVQESIRKAQQMERDGTLPKVEDLSKPPTAKRNRQPSSVRRRKA